MHTRRRNVRTHETSPDRLRKKKGSVPESVTIVSPLKITNPSVLFISSSSSSSPSSPLALAAEPLRLTRLNSSVSARTRFMCLSKARS